MSNEAEDAEVEALPWPVLDPWPAGWLDDTPVEAVSIMRRLSPRRRVITAHTLWRSARAALAMGERLRDPHADADVIDARVRARLAGPAPAR